MGTFGVLPVVPLAAIGYIGTTGSLKTPNRYWLSLATFLLVVNNGSRTSFATALLQKQIDPRVPVHNIFAI